MRALVHDPAAPAGLRSADVEPPVATDAQALIEVHAVSLNFGELAYLTRQRRPGEIPGWDAAGIVVRPAADGSGPPEGTRVVSFDFQGGWARLRAVDTADLAVLPGSVEFGAAAAVPVAGVTALQALRRLGSVHGLRVVVTGASGGVGRFAVQLAARAGAHVIASVGSPARGDGLAELGATEIVVGLDGIGEPVAGVLDTVGGSLLADAFGLLDDGGVAVSIGQASGEPTTIDFERERWRGGLKRLESFVVRKPFGQDLGYLIDLLAMSELDPQIGWRGTWDQVWQAADALLGRRVRGKAILDVDTAA